MEGGRVVADLWKKGKGKKKPCMSSVAEGKREKGRSSPRRSAAAREKPVLSRSLRSERKVTKGERKTPSSLRERGGATTPFNLGVARRGVSIYPGKKKEHGDSRPCMKEEKKKKPAVLKRGEKEKHVISLFPAQRGDGR